MTIMLIRSLITIILAFMSSLAFADELEIINRPVNVHGMTGLVNTTAPYILEDGVYEVSAALLSENSTIPDYSLTEYPVTISYGLGNKAELALRSSYFHIKESVTTTAITERRTGDLSISCKYLFMEPDSDALQPTVAWFATALIPTQNNTDVRFDVVTHWGVRLGLSAGTEVTWKDHVLGLYGDVLVQAYDAAEKRLRDVSEAIHLGLIFPISKYQNLQMFMEYGQTFNTKRITLNGNDQTSFTYGLRLVGERFNFTMGTEFIHRQQEGFGRSDRMSALMSYKL